MATLDERFGNSGGQPSASSPPSPSSYPPPPTPPAVRDTAPGGVILTPLDQPENTEPGPAQVVSGFGKGLADIPVAVGESVRAQFPQGTAAQDITEAAPTWGPWALDYYRGLRSWAGQSKGGIEDASRLLPIALAVAALKGRGAGQITLPAIARALTSAGVTGTIGAMAGSHYGGGNPGAMAAGGALGSTLGGIFARGLTNPASLAMIAAEAYRNPEIRRFFGYGPDNLAAPAPSQPNDPHSIESIQKQQSEDQRRLDDQMRQFNDDVRAEQDGGSNPPTLSPISPTPSENPAPSNAEDQ